MLHLGRFVCASCQAKLELTRWSQFVLLAAALLVGFTARVLLEPTIGWGPSSVVAIAALTAVYLLFYQWLVRFRVKRLRENSVNR
jgi:hypothetical protein